MLDPYFCDLLSSLKNNSQIYNSSNLKLFNFLLKKRLVYLTVPENGKKSHQLFHLQPQLRAASCHVVSWTFL